MPTCSEPTCAADIDFARKLGGSSLMPFDRDKVDDPEGEYIVFRISGTAELLYRRRQPDERLRPGEHLAVSHYRTCTNPGAFTKRGAR